MKNEIMNKLREMADWCLETHSGEWGKTAWDEAVASFKGAKEIAILAGITPDEIKAIMAEAKAARASK